MFHHSDKVEDKKVIAGNKLMSYAKVLYGVTPENLPVELFQLTLKYITSNFKNITINDIDEAYQNAEIEKREYVSLTRDELLKPLKAYWSKKELVRIEYNKLVDIEKGKIEVLKQENMFLIKAENLYNKSLAEGKMLLDEFESSVIAPLLKEYITKGEEELIDIDSKRENKERRIKAEEENSVFVSVPSSEYIKSRMIIEKCLEKKITITKKK